MTGFPFPAYQTDEQLDLPLTSTQCVLYELYPASDDRDYPSVVSCKVKSAAYLNKTIANPGAVD